MKIHILVLSFKENDIPSYDDFLFGILDNSIIEKIFR